MDGGRTCRSSIAFNTGRHARGDEALSTWFLPILRHNLFRLVLVLVVVAALAWLVVWQTGHFAGVGTMDDCGVIGPDGSLKYVACE